MSFMYSKYIYSSIMVTKSGFMWNFTTIKEFPRVVTSRRSFENFETTLRTIKNNGIKAAKLESKS